jgi:hypothetical protein
MKIVQSGVGAGAAAMPKRSEEEIAQEKERVRKIEAMLKKVEER